LLNNEVKINPEYAELVSALSVDEYEQLKHSIKQNGLWHSITINEAGYILDGHHRFKICQELQLEPKIEHKKFKNPLHEKLFIINSNLNRRQLNEFQKVEMLLKSKSIFKEVAREKQRKGGKNKVSQIPDEPIRVDEQIGKRANVSRDTVRKVEFLLENATVEKIDRLRKGKARISKEYSKIQNVIRIEKARRAAIDTIHAQNGSSLFDLKLGDMKQLGKNIPDNSIDLIFTDPPYAEKSLPLYEDLAKLSCRVLKEGGSVVTYAPNPQLDKIFVMMSTITNLKFALELAVHHNGHVAVNWKYRTWPAWKPLLWYFKGDKPTKFHDMSEFIESNPVDKHNHEWEQSTVEAEHVIKPLTVEGMTVLDPFMGSGTTGIVALELSRKFIGIEIDENHFELATMRLNGFGSRAR
jgi:DNA modification methylase